MRSTASSFERLVSRRRSSQPFSHALETIREDFKPTDGTYGRVHMLNTHFDDQPTLRGVYHASNRIRPEEV